MEKVDEDADKKAAQLLGDKKKRVEDVERELHDGDDETDALVAKDKKEVNN